MESQKGWTRSALEKTLVQSELTADAYQHVSNSSPNKNGNTWTHPNLFRTFVVRPSPGFRHLPALLATGRYTLKVAFGHPSDVAVLDGGLPRWKELGAWQLLCSKTMGYPETLEGAEDETRREGMMRWRFAIKMLSSWFKFAVTQPNYM